MWFHSGNKNIVKNKKIIVKQTALQFFFTVFCRNKSREKNSHCLADDNVSLLPYFAERADTSLINEKKKYQNQNIKKSRV